MILTKIFSWEVRSVSLMLYGVLVSKLKNEMLTFQEFSKKYLLASKHFKLELNSIGNKEVYHIYRLLLKKINRIISVLYWVYGVFLYLLLATL